jgi:hypothetical protein
MTQQRAIETWAAVLTAAAHEFADRGSSPVTIESSSSTSTASWPTSPRACLLDVSVVVLENVSRVEIADVHR